MGKVTALSFGADPEGFIRDRVSGQCFPACALVPEPLSTPYGKIAHDGVQLEIQPNPETAPLKLWKNIRKLREAAQLYLNQLYDGRFRAEYKTISLHLTPEEIARISPEGLQLLCNKSYSISKNEESIEDRINQIFKDRPVPIRSAAGHLHLQSDVLADISKPNVVGWLDLTVGLQTVFQEPPSRIAEATRRRVFYGRAGEYRIPEDDRLEYRTPSATWTTTPRGVFRVCNTARWAMNRSRVINHKVALREIDSSRKELEGTINFHDVDRAKELHERLMRTYV